MDDRHERERLLVEAALRGELDHANPERRRRVMDEIDKVTSRPSSLITSGNYLRYHRENGNGA